MTVSLCSLCTRNSFTRVEHVFASQIKQRYSNSKIYIYDMGPVSCWSRDLFRAELILRFTQHTQSAETRIQVQNIK